MYILYYHYICKCYLDKIQIALFIQNINNDMIEPKIYIAKAIKNSDGTYSAGSEVDIQTFFKGAYYNAIDGLDAYGKTVTYSENYAENESTDIFFPKKTKYEESEFSIKLYFFDKDNHTNETDAIKAIDDTYHAFVDYISGCYIKFWDNIRKRKVMLSYQGGTNPEKDSLYGLIYKSVTFKFNNVFGRSFPLNDDIF